MANVAVEPAPGPTYSRCPPRREVVFARSAEGHRRRNETMPTYITLWKFTQEGIENIEDSPDRLDDVIELMESLGGKLQFYFTMGAYDIVWVAEFPDDDAAVHAFLRVGQVGAARSETLKAWTEDEYRDLVANLP